MLEGVLKGRCDPDWDAERHGVSILGMLEGVLKVAANMPTCIWKRVSILGMLEGVLKASGLLFLRIRSLVFQSLVCWRGC